MRPAWWRLRVALALGTLAVGGCGTSPAETRSPSIRGRTFEVITVDGARLPTLAPLRDGATCRSAAVVRSEFVFGADASFEHRVWAAGGVAPTPAVLGASYSLPTTDQVLIEFNGSTGTLRGDTLTMVMEAERGIVCERRRWISVAR